jgi:hypothetical protein
VGTRGTDGCASRRDDECRGTRSRGRILDSQPVTFTGAVYQDFRGVPEYDPRRIAFSATPGWEYSHFRICPFPRPESLGVGCQKPLAVTDIVPDFINAGDSATARVISVLIRAYQEALERALGSVGRQVRQMVRETDAGRIAPRRGLAGAGARKSERKAESGETTEALESDRGLCLVESS